MLHCSGTDTVNTGTYLSNFVVLGYSSEHIRLFIFIINGNNRLSMCVPRLCRYARLGLIKNSIYKAI